MKRRIFLPLLILMIVACVCLLFACNETPIETGYSITYNLNGGIVDSNPTTYSQDDEFLINNPTKEGYTFTGWTYEGQAEPQLFVRIKKGTTGDKNFVANFTEYSFSQLKVAVFADVQLRDKDNNQDATGNAYLALKNHFNYAKSIDADVILMNGDIVNNAVKGYYELFLDTFKSVYGEDESEYPEFVMNMGNHEWWNKNEVDTPGAVSLFRKYARIDSKYLIRESEIPYERDNEKVPIPTYYKIIQGVPFLAISAENSSGIIGNKLQNEIASWLKEISQLESVKKGGPIYVLYHYPIPEITYNGEQAKYANATINELLKDYPNAVVFTGDTHFNSVNERTINQVDYTSINLGTSSYSRSMCYSATYFEYDNVNGIGGKSGEGTMRGDVNFKFQYTPTMMVITMDSPEQAKIDRFFTTDNVNNATHIGKTWELKPIKSKNAFTYTNSRIQNTNSAVELYGKTGLDWASGEVVRFNVEGANMFINFNDVIDYNCAEHYRIEVKDTNNASNVKYYDFMSHYYKYDASAHAYNFVLENIPSATNYTVTVTAYDFFDNISTNTLQSNIDDNTLLFPEIIDLKTIDTYANITKRVNYDVKADGSNSSVEYYFKGSKRYNAGMIINRVIIKGNGITREETLEEFLSIQDWSNAVLKFKVKNTNNYSLTFGLTLFTDTLNIDFNANYRVTVSANSEWKTISWNLKDMGVSSLDEISNLSIKVAVPNEIVDIENGYESNFFIDDIDIIEG